MVNQALKPEKLKLEEHNLMANVFECFLSSDILKAHQLFMHLHTGVDLIKSHGCSGMLTFIGFRKRKQTAF